MASVASIRDRWPGLLWTARSLEERTSWRLQLVPEVVQEFVDYLAHDGQTGAGFRWDPARLPKMAGLGRYLCLQLIGGDGLCWLSGIDELDLGLDAQHGLFLALSHAIGKPVANRGLPHAITRSQADAGFHTDSSSPDAAPDFVGLMCVESAGDRCDSLISNALQLYHNLRVNNSEVLDRLEAPWLRDVATPGLNDDDCDCTNHLWPIYERSLRPGGIDFRYSRDEIDRGYRHGGRVLSLAATRALDVLDEHLAQPDNVALCRMAPGDMLWLNNRTLAYSLPADRELEGDTTRFLRMWVDAEADTY